MPIQENLENANKEILKLEEDIQRLNQENREYKETSEILKSDYEKKIEEKEETIKRLKIDNFDNMKKLDGFINSDKQTRHKEDEETEDYSIENLIENI